MLRNQPICLMIGMLISFNAFSHGDLHERIAKVSNEIKTHPDSAYLYLKRGTLYFQHEDFKKSLLDLKKSETLGFNSIELTLQFAKTYQKLKDYDKSTKYATIILTESPQHVRALKIKANNLFATNHFQEAAITFEKVIAYSNQPLPENYVDASLAWEQLHNELGYLRAEQILLKGIEHFGNLISLYARLKELAINHKDYEKAIDVQKKIIAFIPRKEFAYVELCKLYLEIGNDEEAVNSINNAKKSINKLPQRLKNSAFINDLTKTIISIEAKLRSN